MHEVGHTLGLRHNFKASSIVDIDTLNDGVDGNDLAGSVMDYLPANFALEGEEQGDFYQQTLGPYDYWAIEYAYTTKEGDLEKIADRSPEADLTYATDEDLWFNPDPRIGLFETGDPLDYAERRVKLYKEMVDGLAERVVAEGEGWQRARDAFQMAQIQLARAGLAPTLYIDGLYTSRDHRGEEEDADEQSEEEAGDEEADDDDSAGEDGDEAEEDAEEEDAAEKEAAEKASPRLPMRPIPVEEQRRALALVAETLFEDEVWEVDPELLKRLAPEHQVDN